jgi:hypothetical protein
VVDPGSPVPHSVTGITLSGSLPYARPAAGTTGAADGPAPVPARRLTDVRDYSDTTVHGGRPVGNHSGAVPDEQGEVTA